MERCWYNNSSTSVDEIAHGVFFGRSHSCEDPLLPGQLAESRSGLAILASSFTAEQGAQVIRGLISPMFTSILMKVVNVITGTGRFQGPEASLRLPT